MKKLNKLCAILFAVLGVQTLSAQTNIIADWDGGSNTGKPTTFGWVSSYGSRNWGELNGGGARVTNTYSDYKKEDGSTYSYVADSEPSTQILWIRYNSTSETYTYTFQGLEAGKVYRFTGLVGWHNNSNAPTFTIRVNGDKEIAKVTKYCGAKQTMYPFSVDFMVPADNQSENFTLTFNSNQANDNMEALSALSIVENTDVKNATEASPYDMTSWLQDPSFENNGSGWGMTTTFTNWGANAIAGDAGKLNKQQWNGNFEVTQTLSNIPNGAYRLSVQGFYRPGGNDATSTAQNAILYANDSETSLMLVSAGGKDTQDAANGFTTAYTGVTPNVFVPNSQNDASKAFSTGAYSDNIVKVNVSNNTLKLGVKKEIHIGNDWTVIDNFKLEYLGYDLSEALNALNALVVTAQGIIDADEVSPQSVLRLQAAIEAANSVQQTEEAIAEASTALTEVINAANATIAACNEYRSMLALSESMYTNSTADDKSTFEAAINKAKSDFNAATSIDAISAIVTDLQNAQKAYCLVATPAEGHPFDMTFLVVNPYFDENTNGWSYNTGASNHGRATNQGGAITGGFFENWDWNSYTGEIYQEITNLPKGTYRLTAAAFRDQLIEGASDADAVYVFANENSTLVNSATPALYSVEVTTTTGTLRFGVQSKAKVYRWMGIDNVTLQFVAGLDLSEFIAAYNAAKDAAIAARDNAEYSNVGGAEKAALLAAIAISPEETQESLNNATDELVAATNAFIAAKGDYDKLSAEIMVAQGLGMTDDQINAVISDKTGRQAYPALKVAEYNYVTENFNYNVALSSEWTKEGPVGELSDQHWSGEKRPYMEQSSAAWGWDAWTISYDQDLTLPAGEYVFKVAGRKASGNGCTLNLTVTSGGNVLGTVNDFPEGDTGLGINKKGETSFDANDEAGFANNNAGRAWQWRYVKFTLASKTTVNIAVNAVATTNHQWISFCDATVQMTEDTYLAANMGALDAPTAAANALVDSKPMGTAENEALKVALALPLETGAHLLAKIDALNTAVANANAWVGEYNNAKISLVTALERFEADYNDAQNGALNHMNKDRWATVIEKAQAAAVAKDATDSYEGFESAAGDLNDALDAATVSINEYARLKAAIDEATPYLGGNDWGSEPFQKPESAKDYFNAIKTTAQNAYDTAEVDGDGVTAVIGSLNTAINDVVLNAPEDGQRFYIKVATEGHGKKNNAILATLGATSANNPTGYGLNTDNVVKGYLAQAFIFTQVEGNLYNISIERPEGTVYLTYGSLNGSAAGWKNQQIQATTDEENKGEFKIVPTGKNGILKIFNTVDNNYLDCQDGGAIYTDTGISNEEFAFELATEHSVTLDISSAGWATLILPFNAEIPDGVTVYGSKEFVEGEFVRLEEAETIVANTPYLIEGTEVKSYNFSGYGLADKDVYEDANEMFVGTYVDYETVGGEYVLQILDGKVAFYQVGDSKPKVKANRCYLNAPANPAKAFFFFDDEATGINGVDAAGAEIVAIYTVNGAKVNRLQKGLNIVKMSNGKTQKVFVK